MASWAGATYLFEAMRLDVEIMSDVEDAFDRNDVAPDLAIKLSLLWLV